MGVPTGAVSASTRAVVNSEWGREHPWVFVLVFIVLCVVIKSLQHMGCMKEETQEGDASPV